MANTYQATEELEGPNAQSPINGAFAARYKIEYNDGTGYKTVTMLQDFSFSISIDLSVIDSIEAENICYQYGTRRYTWSATFIAGKTGGTFGSAEALLDLCLSLGMFDISLSTENEAESRYSFGTTVLSGCSITSYDVSNFTSANTAPSVSVQGMALRLGCNGKRTDGTYKYN